MCKTAIKTRVRESCRAELCPYTAKKPEDRLDLIARGSINCSLVWRPKGGCRCCFESKRCNSSNIRLCLSRRLRETRSLCLKCRLCRLSLV